MLLAEIDGRRGRRPRPRPLAGDEVSHITVVFAEGVPVALEHLLSELAVEYRRVLPVGNGQPADQPALGGRLGFQVDDVGRVIEQVHGSLLRV